MRTRFIIATLVFVNCVYSIASVFAAEPPNVVMILSDDHGKPS
ncbi:hypothetical protein SH528x_007085 [Novipirellula sp. SH528]